MEPNPGLIQPPSKDNLYSTPLVLFHDGGGTTISYYHLGSLGRPVYGIADPSFFTGRTWSGLPQMAKVYANLIRTTLTSPRVILGGWSLGGFIALEVARILECEGQFHVVGVVMIDSPYPHGPTDTVVPPRPFLHANCSPETRMFVSRSMKRAHKLVEKWSVPDWTSSSFLNTDSVPPVMLLRCQEYVPHEQSEEDQASTRVSVDRWRHLRMLGWERTGGLFRGVLDIPGHHFNLMWEENLDAITRQLKLACKMLDLSLIR
ncbi:alpha/beta-hydrolase [Aspergillus sclerotiicarbonarius CBS 121057]|uniref:Alpha/beta-hydrolase n=1 Tax=Aspergillus sclerotiicarbonarius (strain CBS 121057 / IBT 28362) TaxID=1448318 RepID=A0A319EWB1_ASPSB|nr:alpha/beta-hydrolase [Aspergillus sclerotiicarbonarius CBS 121057]